jgi:hypothetical protein
MNSFAVKARSASGATHRDESQSESENQSDSDFPEDPRPVLQRITRCMCYYILFNFTGLFFFPAKTKVLRSSTPSPASVVDIDLTLEDDAKEPADDFPADPWFYGCEDEYPPVGILTGGDTPPHASTSAIPDLSSSPPQPDPTIPDIWSGPCSFKLHKQS